ncbi:MAG: NAD(+)/NADH kinase, partial [Actinobacteria bacterium]|nr:NAD(+)/NADH kinase [Actinomycetota bacterium]
MNPREPRGARRAHAAVVYNPATAEIDLVRRVVSDQERRAGWGRSRWFETAGEDSGRLAAETALGSHPAVVIVVGGDGTARAVGEVAYQQGVP